MIRSTSSNALPRLFFTAAFAVGLFAPFASAQEANPTSVAAPKNTAVVTQNGDIFFYRVKAVERDIDAVNYLHRSGSTKVGFDGTELLPGAHGDASVKSERGGISIEAEFKGLTPANGFGPEYLTYVLWAITPDGRPNNLGEVLPAGTKNNITATTSLQAFGLIVTAEPYFSVTTPSDVIVLKNVVKNDTNGVLEKVNAHTTLLPRGNYAATTDGAHTNANPVTRDEKSPLELYEAYNAVRIATAAGADKYAADILAKANTNLKNAADIDSSKKSDRKLEITFARAAVQGAEDARVATLRKQSAERQQNAETAKDQAQMQASASQADAANANAEAEAARAAKAQADRDRAAAEAAAAAANAQAAAATAQAQSATQGAAEMREKLRTQLNSVLATSENARGLIVNLSDVLFDTGKYSLKQQTQVSLAKVSGILLAYPGLNVQVEGYTDSVGSDESNQKLSENRANSVRNFLISQGVKAEAITAAGFGKTSPVADNGTADGRAQNRRVNLVVSGDAIGVTQSTPAN